MLSPADSQSAPPSRVRFQCIFMRDARVFTVEPSTVPWNRIFLDLLFRPLMPRHHCIPPQTAFINVR